LRTISAKMNDIKKLRSTLLPQAKTRLTRQECTC
jgi:hypothetical protein